MLQCETHRVLVVDGPRSLRGSVRAPPSKSYTHRALMVACLDGSAKIVNPLYCEDTLHTIAAWRGLGARISVRGNDLDVCGCGGSPRIAGGRVVRVGESGTLLRFILPSLAVLKGRVRVEGAGSLVSRPNRQVVEALRSWGVEIQGRGPEHLLPIVMRGGGFLRGGVATVEGNVTSQAVSALLLAAPLAKRDTVLRVSCRLVSRPYVDVTMDVLRWAGVRVEREGYKVFRVKGGRGRRGMRPRGPFVVHGDYSSAAFLIAAAALTESDVAISDLVEDCQGDRRIVGILREMGARIEHAGGIVRVRGPFDLKGIDVDCSDIPDLVPILATVGCFAKGVTRIRNVSHLAHKESNRLVAPAEELGRLGARIRVGKDELRVRGSRMHGGTVSARGDHRIAMSLAVAGLAIGGGVRVGGAEAIAKSYPSFVVDMRRLHAGIREE